MKELLNWYWWILARHFEFRRCRIDGNGFVMFYYQLGLSHHVFHLLSNYSWNNLSKILSIKGEKKQIYKFHYPLPMDFNFRLETNHFPRKLIYSVDKQAMSFQNCKFRSVRGGCGYIWYIAIFFIILGKELIIIIK